MDIKKRLANLEKIYHKKRSVETHYVPGTDLGATGDTQTILSGLGLVEREYTSGTIWSCRLPPLTNLQPGAGFPDLRAIFTKTAPGDIKTQELLFLDTETTGLAGGTGTFAFLIGLAWWTDTGFVVQQLFLPGPGRETPMLYKLADIAARFRVVVTFNGNGFDLPLLRTRARMSRLTDSLASLVSWDLLPAVRRLWRRRLVNCRQQTIETNICKRERGHGDIDGALIPQAYFQYLRTGQTGFLRNVLTHNRRDMVGMGEIFNAVSSIANRITYCRLPLSQKKVQSPLLNDADLCWQDAWSFGRICEARHDRQRAALWLQQALDCSPIKSTEIEIPERFLTDAIRILKRTANWKCVEQTILAGLGRWPESAWLHREAAILYEHRLGQLHRAYQHARILNEPGRVDRLRRKLGLLESL